MTAEQADILKSVIMLVACLFSRQAAAILLLHIFSVVIKEAFISSPVGMYCLISCMFCSAASSEIRISSSIRYVLFAIGALNFGAAMEFYAFDYKTIYYQALPAAINALDLIIIALLLTGGRGFVGFTVLHYIRARLASFNARYLRYNPQDKVLQTKGYHKK